VLPGADTATASDIADALRRAVDSLQLYGLQLSCSCGVATGRGESVDFGVLLAEADAALYDAKRRGRGRETTVIAAAPAR
jgi:PleD family two-component response regulator